MDLDSLGNNNHGIGWIRIWNAIVTFCFHYFACTNFYLLYAACFFYHLSHYRTGDFSDLEVVVKGSEAIKFKCHQFIVSARSPVMAAMLKHPMQVRISPIFLRD
jgi:hypothetical protein